MQLMHVPALLLLVVTQFNGALYYFDECNEYCRGPLFFCWQGITIASFLFIFVVYLIERKKTDRFLRQIICTACIVPTLGFILNLSYSGISFNNIAVSVAAFIIFRQHRIYRKNIGFKRKTPDK